MASYHNDGHAINITPAYPTAYSTVPAEDHTFLPPNARDMTRTPSPTPSERDALQGKKGENFIKKALHDGDWSTCTVSLLC
jgi:hypothetical protein